MYVTAPLENETITNEKLDVMKNEFEKMKSYDMETCKTTTFQQLHQARGETYEALSSSETDAASRLNQLFQYQGRIHKIVKDGITNMMTINGRIFSKNNLVPPYVHVPNLDLNYAVGKVWHKIGYVCVRWSWPDKCFKAYCNYVMSDERNKSFTEISYYLNDVVKGIKKILEENIKTTQPLAKLKEFLKTTKQAYMNRMEYDGHSMCDPPKTGTKIDTVSAIQNVVHRKYEQDEIRVRTIANQLFPIFKDVRTSRQS